MPCEIQEHDCCARTEHGWVAKHAETVAHVLRGVARLLKGGQRLQSARPK